MILTNGSDGQNVDMWTYGVPAALDRGWNALVYDGPGQGQLLFVDQVVFTPTWEKVVTPSSTGWPPAPTWTPTGSP